MEAKGAFFVIDDAELDGSFGYWAEDEDDRAEGLLDAREDVFYSHGENNESCLQHRFQGRRSRKGKGKGRGSKGLRRGSTGSRLLKSRPKYKDPCLFLFIAGLLYPPNEEHDGLLTDVADFVLYASTVKLHVTLLCWMVALLLMLPNLVYGTRQKLMQTPMLCVFLFLCLPGCHAVRTETLDFPSSAVEGGKDIFTWRAEKHTSLRPPGVFASMYLNLALVFLLQFTFSGFF